MPQTVAALQGLWRHVGSRAGGSLSRHSLYRRGECRDRRVSRKLMAWGFARTTLHRALVGARRGGGRAMPLGNARDGDRAAAKFAGLGQGPMPMDCWRGWAELSRAQVGRIGSGTPPGNCASGSASISACAVDGLRGSALGPPLPDCCHARNSGGSMPGGDLPIAADSLEQALTQFPEITTRLEGLSGRHERSWRDFGFAHSP